MFATNSVLQKVATVLFPLRITLINTEYLSNTANTACAESKQNISFAFVNQFQQG